MILVSAIDYQLVRRIGVMGRTMDGTIIRRSIDLPRWCVVVVSFGEDHPARHLVRLPRPVLGTYSLRDERCTCRSKRDLVPLLHGRLGRRTAQPVLKVLPPPDTHSFPEDQPDIRIVDCTPQSSLDLRRG